MPAKTHGMYKSPEYAAWRNAKRRCHDSHHPSYYNYGARGITMCARWRNSFEAFLSDMGRRPHGAHITLERVDNNAGYAPDNCVWATRQAQQRNTRKTHLVTWRGRTECLSEWAKIVDIPATTILGRLRRGLTTEEALSLPKWARPHLGSTIGVQP